MSKKYRTPPSENEWSQQIADEIVEVINGHVIEDRLRFTVILSALIRATSFFIAGIPIRANRDEVLEDFHTNLTTQIEVDRKNGIFSKTEQLQ